MRIIMSIIPLFAVFSMLSVGAIDDVAAQENGPVKITFDTNSDRIDIKTGTQLPPYTEAERGSIRFYQSRLDTPDEGFWYYIDGRRFQRADRTVFMRKLPNLGTWAIAGLNIWGEPNLMETEAPLTTHPKYNCEILHHAVSFIPLDLETGEPCERVYVLLDDMDRIQWKAYDHWLATVYQEELAAMQGTIY